MGDARGKQLRAKFGDGLHQGSRDGDRLDPTQSDRGFRLCVRTPEGRVLCGDVAGDRVGDQTRDPVGDRVARGAGRVHPKGHFAASKAAVTVSSNSPHDTLNLSTPSFSSRAVTSSKSTPTAAS